jgi:hypothetical protein
MRWLAIFALLATFSAWAQQPAPTPLPQPTVTGQPDHKTEESKQKAAPEQQAPAPAPSIVKIPERKDAQKEAKPNSTQAPNEPAEAKGWSLSDKIAAIASVVALLQFGALIWTIGVMRSSAQRQLRAYVSGRPNFIFSFDKTKVIRVSFNLLNVGVTPAHKVRHRGNVVIAPNPIVAGFALPELTSSLSAPLVLFPNLQFNGFIAAESVLNEAQIAQIIEGTASIYVYGEVFYEDIFGTERTARFCSRTLADRETLQKLANNYGPTDLIVNFEVAPMGNNAT